MPLTAAPWVESESINLVPWYRLPGLNGGLFDVASRAPANTTKNRGREVSLPAPADAPRYSNEAITGEMCVLGTVTTDVQLKSIGGKDLLPQVE